MSMLTSLCENADATWPKAKRLLQKASAFARRRSRYLLLKALRKLWSAAKFGPQSFRLATNWRSPEKNFVRDKFMIAIQFCYNRSSNAVARSLLRPKIAAMIVIRWEKQFKALRKMKS